MEQLYPDLREKGPHLNTSLRKVLEGAGEGHSCPLIHDYKFIRTSSLTRHDHVQALASGPAREGANVHAW
eukprot:6211732-Pleurochrysis_carterae.AAC.1